MVRCMGGKCTQAMVGVIFVVDRFMHIVHMAGVQQCVGSCLRRVIHCGRWACCSARHVFCRCICAFRIGAACVLDGCSARWPPIMSVCMHVCMYVCMYACMYVCMFVCLNETHSRVLQCTLRCYRARLCYNCAIVCSCIHIHIHTSRAPLVRTIVHEPC